MRRSVCWAASLLVLLTACHSRHLEMEVRCDELPDQPLYLAVYDMGMPRAVDTVMLQEGKGVFEADTLLPEGVYLLYLQDGSYVDVLLGKDQRLSLDLKLPLMPKNMTVTGADETAAFAAYSSWLFQEQHNEDFDAEEASRRQQLRHQFAGGMLDVFLSLDDAPHWNDARQYRTPYMGHYVASNVVRAWYVSPDSAVNYSLQLVEASKSDPEAFRMVTEFLMRYSLESGRMGLDNIMYDLYTRYYCSGEACWVSPEHFDRIKKQVDKMQYCRVGQLAHNLELADENGQYGDLSSLCGTQMTVLVFFEPDCDACVELLPKVKQFYDAYVQDPRVQLVTVSMSDNKSSMQQLIRQVGLQQASNRWDPERRSAYWKWFDTSKSPTIYVLDAGQCIYAKDLDPEQLPLAANRLVE